MRNVITFGGTSLDTYGLYNNGRETYGSPAKSYDMVKIPGKSGDLVFDNKRFENFDLKYPSCFIKDNFETNIELLRAYLLSRNGYQRLEDTYHPNEYRMAVCKNAMDVNVDMYNKFGSFDLIFNCKPQRFLKSGETSTTLTASGTINNPTSFDSKPLLRVYGVGILGIGNQSIIISEADVYTDIDCDIMEAYKGTVSKNDKISVSNYTFPVLKPGNNGIDLGTGITQVVITPRWWTI